MRLPRLSSFVSSLITIYLGKTTSCTFQENRQGVQVCYWKHERSFDQLAYSFVYPYLIYCNHVWGLACKTHMNTSFLLQKTIIRIISGVNRSSHTGPIFKELKSLKCYEIHTYLIGRFMPRIYNGDITLLQSYLKKNKEVHHYGTRQINHCYVLPVKIELGKSALRLHGVVIWNKTLNLGMDPAMTEYEFSKSLKKHLLQNRL